MINGPGLACAGCKTLLRPRKNEVIVRENSGDSNLPYRIWMADLWECPKCGTQIISGYGENPVAINFKSEQMQRWLPQVTHTIDGKLHPLP